MTSRTKAVLWGRQPGTAHAFIPVLRQLKRSRPAVSFEVIGTDLAIDAFRANDISVTPVDEFAEATAVLDGHDSVDLLLTGTSLEVQEDAQYWRWAKENDIASVAFVDNWCNYWQRFSTSPDCRFDATPDRIAVIDELLRRRMIQQGAPADRVVVSGDPRLALLREKSIPRRDIRRKLGLNPNDVLLAFVAEPLSTAYADPEGRLGYDEWEALAAVISAADCLQETQHPTVYLTVRPHPREPADKYASFVAERTESCQIVDTTAIVDQHRLVGTSDVVFGMHSMLLYESTVLGTPAVSLRPDNKATSDLVDGHDVIHCADNPRQAVDIVLSAHHNGQPAEQAPTHPASIDDFIDVVFAPLNQHQNIPT